MKRTVKITGWMACQSINFYQEKNNVLVMTS